MKQQSSEQEIIHWNIHELIQHENDPEQTVLINAYEAPNGDKVYPIKFYGREYWITTGPNNPLTQASTIDITRIMYAYLHERVSRNLVLPILRPGDTFVDVGAHYGSWSLPAIAMGARVIAIEPDQTALLRLKRHIQLNNFEERIEIVKKTICKNSPNNLDSILENVVNIRLIKIDVEGAEFDVLRGAKKTIKKYKPNLLVELHTMMHDKSVEDEIEFIKKIYPHYKTVSTSQQVKEGDAEAYHCYHYT